MTDVRAELTKLFNDIDRDGKSHHGVVADGILVLVLLPQGVIDRDDRDLQRSVFQFAAEQIQNDVRGADLADAVADYLERAAA